MKKIVIKTILCFTFSINVFAQTYNVTTFSGNGVGSTNGASNADSLISRFSNPTGVATDNLGNVYVADSYNQTIRKISKTGIVTTIAGISGKVGNTDGSYKVALFSNPTGVAVDNLGNVYVADAGNNKIRQISISGVVSTFAGTGVIGNKNGMGTVATFNNPIGIVFDKQGNLYVADKSNHNIRKITPQGFVSLFAGISSSGYSDSYNGSATFNNPSGLTIDNNGYIYVADAGNNRVRKISSSGYVSTFAGTGVAGYLDGDVTVAKFNGLTGVSYDTINNILFVADKSSHIIRAISSSGIVSTLAGSNKNGVWGANDANGNNALFYYPSGLTTDSQGNVYIADSYNNKIRKVTLAGDVTTYAGTGAPGSLDGNCGIAASFDNLYGISLDKNGNLYVADSWNNKVRKITPSGFVTTIAGAGAQGSLDDTTTNATFNYPYSVVSDQNGNVYVSDGNSKIRKISTLGYVTTFAGSTQGNKDGVGTSALFNIPKGMVIDNLGNIYVADYGNNKIRKITSSGVVSTFAGSGSVGSFDGIGTSATFNKPTGITIDKLGNIYVADNGNNLIRKIAPNGTVSTVNVISGGFYSIIGLSIDKNGNIIVVDNVTHTVKNIDINGVVTLIAGTPGVSGFKNGDGSIASFNKPTNIIVDSIGNIFVADQGNSAIRKISNNSTVTEIVDQNSVNNYLSLSPNPSQNTLNISSDLDISNYEIINLSGKLVQSGLFERKEISISQLSVGMYFIKLQTKQGVGVLKFVKE